MTATPAQLRNRAEVARVRTAALRMLQTFRPSLTARELAKAAECSEQDAAAALRVLAHERKLRAVEGRPGAYALAEGGQEGTAT